MAKPRIPFEAIAAAFPEAKDALFLDAGGQSDVWRIVLNGRPEVLRVLVQAGDAARVKQEMAALRAIASDHVMRVYDVRQIRHLNAEHQVVRAEFIEGRLLRSHARRSLRPKSSPHVLRGS